MPAGMQLDRVGAHGAHAEAASPAAFSVEAMARLLPQRGIWRLVYRSRATRAFEAPELHEMIHLAQARNASESVTGLVVYDRSNFYQWLEGPVDGLARLIGSINDDVRHTDVQVLSSGMARTRQFSGWSMQLAGSVPRGGAGVVVCPPYESLAALRRTPDAAAEILAGLAPRRRTGGRRPPSPISRILREVILSRVIPELAGRHCPPGPSGPQRHPRVEELARLLALGDSRAASALVLAAMAGSPRLVPMLANLAEPAARRLGDFWADDKIGEPDVTLGLCCLRTAVRQAALGAPPAPPSAEAPLVLSASQPGEPHALGPTLHPEAMLQAGWLPSVALPGSEDALLDRLAGQRFDCLDLSLSATFARDERLPKVAEMIARARRASRNPSLAVVVSGRATTAAGAGWLGADASIPSALHVVGAVRLAMTLRAL